jgi:hypothetical protein
VSEIRFNDRILVLGPSQSGKSEVLNLLFSDLTGGAQRVLLDTKGEFAIADVQPVSEVSAIDWSAPIIHYRDRGIDGEMQELCAAVFARRRITLCVHELSDVCDYNAGKTPAAFNAICSKGAGLGVGMWGGSQRPYEIPSRAKSEPLHVFIVVPRFMLEQDIKSAAQAINRPHQELSNMLDELQATLGDYSFLHFDRRAGTLEACEPLSEAERARIIVARPVLY